MNFESGTERRWKLCREVDVLLKIEKFVWLVKPATPFSSGLGVVNNSQSLENIAESRHLRRIRWCFWFLRHYCVEVFTSASASSVNGTNRLSAKLSEGFYKFKSSSDVISIWVMEEIPRWNCGKEKARNQSLFVSHDRWQCVRKVKLFIRFQNTKSV